MVGAPAAADAVARAKRLPSLHVGLHLVLVEGQPVLRPARIPDLVGDDGCFRNDMARAGAAMFFLPRVRRQLAAEIEAQFDGFAATGLKLDHVNAHKHFHVHPTIGETLLRVGKRHGLDAIRVPNEPQALLHEIDPTTRSPSPMLAPCAGLLRRVARQAGLATADRVFGIAWSGAMTSTRVAGLLARLPEGSSELYLHPATNDRFAGSARGYAYASELAALTADSTRDALAASGARLASFASLARS